MKECLGIFQNQKTQRNLECNVIELKEAWGEFET